MYSWIIIVDILKHFYSGYGAKCKYFTFFKKLVISSWKKACLMDITMCLVGKSIKMIAQDV